MFPSVEQVLIVAERASDLLARSAGRLAMTTADNCYIVGGHLLRAATHAPGVVLDCVIANGPAETEKQAGARKYHGVEL